MAKEKELTPGLTEGIQCQFTKTDQALIDKIASDRKIAPDKAKRMLRYNIFTVLQFTDLTGLTISGVAHLMRPSFKNGKLVAPAINHCYPFADKNGSGPKFVVRDEKSEKYLLR